MNKYECYLTSMREYDQICEDSLNKFIDKYKIMSVELENEARFKNKKEAKAFDAKCAAWIKLNDVKEK